MEFSIAAFYGVFIDFFFYIRYEERQEQEAEFAASLAADRAKEEVRRAEERSKQEEIDRQTREQDAIERYRRELAAQIPAEPSESSAPDEPITMIRLRVPDGAPLTRRFRASEALKYLFDFAEVHGFPRSDYNLRESHPNRDVS